MFCDATGVTKAHVFAKSYTSLFDDPNDTREHEVVHDYTDPVTGEKRELKRAKTFALISRKVCAGCNNMWLSELEEKVRPGMADFAANTPVALDESQQADLALWASIAALIAMSMEPEEFRYASPELAHAIYRDRRPPVGIQVWLGGNSHGHMGWFGSHSLNLTDTPERDDAWGASIAFGYAVLHIVFHGHSDRLMRLRYDAHRSLTRIWPTQQTAAWPPRLLMTTRDLSPLAVIVGEQSVFEPFAAAAGRTGGSS
jgi:hypothetical protein